MKFKFKDGERIRTIIAPIATATAIEPGDLVAISSGLIIKAVAASTAVAYCPDGHEANSGTEVVITVGNDFTLTGTADAVFAAANRGTECDILDTTQYLNMDASSTKVLRISACKDAGVVGVASGIEVRINLPLF
jgi:hypothetical protein